MIDWKWSSTMEKQKMLSLIIGILCIASLAAPVMISEDVAFWMWGLLVTMHGEVHFLFEQADQAVFITTFVASTAITGLGALLHFMASGTKADGKKMPAWLPGLLVTIGQGWPTIYYFIALINAEAVVVPVGIIPGLVGGIWAWVLGARATMAKS